MNEVVEQAELLISTDNKEGFKSFVRGRAEEFTDADDDHEDSKSIPLQSELLKLICDHRAVGCARALLELEAETSGSIKVDVNEPLKGLELSPLDLAALSLSYELTEMFLNHHHRTQLVSILPLSLALDAFSEHDYVNEWTPGKSLYKLLYVFCIPELKEYLDTIKLLASKTNQVVIDKVCCNCFEQGKVVQFAALVLVAWDKVVKTNKIDGSPFEKYMYKQARKPSPFACDALLGYNMRRMMDLVHVLENIHDFIEEFRHSEEVKLTKMCDLPKLVSKQLQVYEYEAKVKLFPDLYCREPKTYDLNCFRPQIWPEEKACLEEALEKKMHSSKSTIIGPISFTPFRPLDPDKCERRDGTHDTDDVDEFVKLMNEVKSLNNIIYFDQVASLANYWMFTYDSINCATAVLGGKSVGVFEFGWFFKDGLTPLHLAVSKIAPRLTALFLEEGYDPDGRCDCKEFNLKEALPLTIVLASFRENCSLYEWPRTNSLIDLVAELCIKKSYLETVRLLVQRTQGVKNEFLDYLNQGKIIELCALLLVAHKQFDSYIRQPHTIKELPSSLSFHVGRGRMSYCTAIWPRPYHLDKKIRQLFHIFDKIGDELGAYVQLEEKKDRRTTKLEVTWLMEKAGILVNGEVSDVSDVIDASSREVNSADLYKQSFRQGLPVMSRMLEHVLKSKYGVFHEIRSFNTFSREPRLDLASFGQSRRLVRSSYRGTSILTHLKRGIRRM